MAKQQKKEETTPLVPSSSSSTAANRPKPIYTEAKAKHLFRVYASILTVFFIQGWMSIMIVEPLKLEEELMVRLHEWKQGVGSRSDTLDLSGRTRQPSQTLTSFNLPIVRSGV